ncbi:MAG: ribulose-phosphate 3-epimerase [Anaerocolumna sp.]
MMTKILSPSMMCADYGCLREEIKKLEEAGASRFHIDIMDGIYVPNFGMGLQDTEFICKTTTVPVEVHLMIQNPVNYIEKFILLGADIIFIHPEADIHPVRTLLEIKKLGAVPGIAVNPGTSLACIKELLYYIGSILVMTVNPGFAGQKFLESVSDKVDCLSELKKDLDFEIMIDGACSPEIIKNLWKKGADGFVLGTSALFNKEETYTKIMEKLLEL